jgi:uncharacterized protein with NRDE domain
MGAAPSRACLFRRVEGWIAMCLAAIALHRSARFPLVLAANRDEFHARPTAGMAWWRDNTDDPWVLSGRDLAGGGTWFGVNSQGRWALLTNIRSAALADPAAPSRGQIVSRWLRDGQAIDEFRMLTGLAGHNGFNVIAAQCSWTQGALDVDCHWFSTAEVLPLRLPAGVYGLSNGVLDEPWPKVRKLKDALSLAIVQHRDARGLGEALLSNLQDRVVPPDAELPSTGVPLDVERALGARFVHMPERGYGTRSSLVAIAERVQDGLAMHLFEQSYDPQGRPVERRQACLNGWPRRAEGLSGKADTTADDWPVLRQLGR